MSKEDKSAGKHMHLFEHGIEPADVAQGRLGDCWLISAFACLAEFPTCVEKIFIDKEYKRSGKYRVKIYDALKNKGAGGFTTVVVDDAFPCAKNPGYTNDGKPVFAQLNGNELWVLLLEKAFAKFVGSYAMLEGGQTCWALQAMTGDNCYRFTHKQLQGGDDDAHEWAKLELRGVPSAENPRACSFWTTQEKPWDDDLFYQHLKGLDANGCVLGASSKGQDKTLTEGRKDGGGIVPGHAYTIVNVYESFGCRLLKLRNPWYK